MTKYKILPEAQTGEGLAGLFFEPINYDIDNPVITKLESNSSVQRATKQIRDKDYALVSKNRIANP